METSPEHRAALPGLAGGSSWYAKAPLVLLIAALPALHVLGSCARDSGDDAEPAPAATSDAGEAAAPLSEHVAVPSPRQSTSYVPRKEDADTTCPSDPDTEESARTWIASKKVPSALSDSASEALNVGDKSAADMLTQSKPPRTPH